MSGYKQLKYPIRTELRVFLSCPWTESSEYSISGRSTKFKVVVINVAIDWVNLSMCTRKRSDQVWMMVLLLSNSSRFKSLWIYLLSNICVHKCNDIGNGRSF